MADQPKSQEAPKELAKEQPKMQLEKDPVYGNWVYWRDPWLYGPGIDKNGVIPVNTVERADAERYINGLYPGAFPEPVPASTPAHAASHTTHAEKK
jgi:hypothetical protein